MDEGRRTHGVRTEHLGHEPSGRRLRRQAQQAGTVPRIGYLGISPNIDVELFRQGLRELGRIDGQNITIEYRWWEGKTERLPKLVAELIQLKVDVIYVWGSAAATLAAKQVGVVASFCATGRQPNRLGGGNSVAPKRRSLLKGGKKQLIPMSEEQHAILLAWVSEQPGLKPYDPVLHHGPDRRPYGRNTVEAWVRAWGKDASVVGATPHRFRHSAATDMLCRGVPLEIVQRVLGHVAISTTQRYTRISDASVIRAFLTRSGNPLK